MLRLMRLAKLLKVLRGMRLFKRWEQRIFRHIRYGILRIMKLFIANTMIVHWLACGPSMDN